MTIIPAENSATAPERTGTAAPDSAPVWPLAAEDSFDFVIGPEATPEQAMAQAGALLRVALPMLLKRHRSAPAAFESATAVLTELVDLTARYPAGGGMVARVSYDGSHVMVSVGDMGRTLPTPEEEPGLYLVHGRAYEVGQYAGDRGGLVTWAGIAV